MIKRALLPCLFVFLATACASTSEEQEPQSGSSSAFSLEGKDYLESCTPWAWDCKTGLRCEKEIGADQGVCVHLFSQKSTIGGSCFMDGCTEGRCVRVESANTICMP
jgi:hypothetical protein